MTCPPQVVFVDSTWNRSLSNGEPIQTGRKQQGHLEIRLEGRRGRRGKADPNWKGYFPHQPIYRNSQQRLNSWHKVVRSSHPCLEPSSLYHWLILNRLASQVGRPLDVQNRKLLHKTESPLQRRLVEEAQGSHLVTKLTFLLRGGSIRYPLLHVGSPQTSNDSPQGPTSGPYPARQKIISLEIESPDLWGSDSPSLLAPLLNQNYSLLPTIILFLEYYFHL
ncbi:unnamed protein product [Nezara viridula]|uniref:Uncharacterized protein n=1 Tax=Nezara viridula TaxID=85310 RepID=A0A9P0H2X3_NEZVI|nr:unnamed protein product [Nezara viridula]